MSIDLKAMTKTGPNLKPPKVVIMGVGGIGKTTFYAGDKTQDIVGAPKPYFIFTEEGMGRLSVPRLELRKNDPVVRSFEEVMDAIEALYTQEHEYQTLVIDTFDGLEPLLWDYTARMRNVDDIEAFGYGKGYLYAVDHARQLLQGLDALRNDKGMLIGITAHTDTVKFESPDKETYDRYQLKLHKRLAAALHDWTDVLLFAQWETHVVKDKNVKDKKDPGRARGVGSGLRVMFTQERPAWWAKNRYGLPFKLPLSWTAFQDAIVAPDETPPEEGEPDQAAEPETK